MNNRILPITEMKRDDMGFWNHPDVPWGLLPEDTSAVPFFEELGFESKYTSLQWEDSDASEKWFDDHGCGDCTFWQPIPPEGEGWFLASIYDHEDGPHACWIRPFVDIVGLPALSIRQPWAHLIVHGSKRFENRDWMPNNPGRRFRGRFLIHAGLGMTQDEYAAAFVIAEGHGDPLPDFDKLQRGGIVGVAEVVGWHDVAPDMPYAFGSGLELADVRPLPFMPCKGALGFFKPQFVRPEEGANV